MKHRLVETGHYSGYLLDQTLNKDAKQSHCWIDCRLVQVLKIEAMCEILVGLFPRTFRDKKDKKKNRF